jgi:hypothetical protein
MPPPIEPESTFGIIAIDSEVITWLALVSPITDFKIYFENLVDGRSFMGSVPSSTRFYSNFSIFRYF